MIGIKEPPQVMLEIQDMIFMPDHPGRIFCRYHHVKVGCIEGVKGIIRLDQFPEGIFAAGDFYEFTLV